MAQQDKILQLMQRMFNLVKPRIKCCIGCKGTVPVSTRGMSSIMSPIEYAELNTEDSAVGIDSFLQSLTLQWYGHCSVCVVKCHFVRAYASKYLATLLNKGWIWDNSELVTPPQRRLLLEVGSAFQTVKEQSSFLALMKSYCRMNKIGHFTGEFRIWCQRYRLTGEVPFTRGCSSGPTVFSSPHAEQAPQSVHAYTLTVSRSPRFARCGPLGLHIAVPLVGTSQSPWFAHHGDSAAHPNIYARGGRPAGERRFCAIFELRIFMDYFWAGISWARSDMHVQNTVIKYFSKTFSI